MGKGVPVGEWNYLEVTLGQRGMGKSTLQCARARQLAELAGGAYVIGHSLGARLPKKLPPVFGGGTLPIRYYTTIEELDRGLRKHPADWHILAPPIVGSDLEVLHRQTCDDLIRYSMKLSQSIRDRAYDREHGIAEVASESLLRKLLSRRRKIRDYDGLVCPPIVMIVDEGVAIQSASSGEKSKGKDLWFLEWIYSLRHLHTALLYAVQNPTARNWQLLSEATRVTVFRVRHEWALNAIRAAGGTKYEMEIARELLAREHIVLSDDEGPDERELADDYDETDGGEAVTDSLPDESPATPDTPTSSPTPDDPGKPPAVAGVA